MRVNVVFDFPGVADPDSARASMIVDRITAETVEWQDLFRSCLVENVIVYVDDVTGDSE